MAEEWRPAASLFVGDLHRRRAETAEEKTATSGLPSSLPVAHETRRKASAGTRGKPPRWWLFGRLDQGAVRGLRSPGAARWFEDDIITLRAWLFDRSFSSLSRWSGT